MHAAGRRLVRPVAAVLAGVLTTGTLVLVGAGPVGAAPSTSNLALTVTGAPATFLPGQQVTYTVSVTNNDTIDATGVGVTDTIPADLTYVSGSGTGWTCPAPPATGSVDCTLADTIPSTMTSATLTLTMQLAGSPTANPEANTLTVDGSSPTVTTTASNPVAQSAANTAIAVAVSSTPLVPGQPATYTITVTNKDLTNPVALTGVTDTFPADLTYVSGSGTGWACPAPPATGSVDCTFTPPLAAGASTILTLTMNVSAAPTSNAVTDTATVDGTSPAVTASLTTPLAVSDLALSQAWVTSPTTYAMTVKNLGPESAVGTLTITDPLPANVTFASVSGGDWACVQNAQTLTCTSANATGLAANATSVATVTVTDGPNAGRFTGYPSVALTGTGAGYDPVTANNTAFPLQSSNPALGDGTSGDPGLCGAASANVRTCTLVATDGTLTVHVPTEPDLAIPIWSFALDKQASPTASGTAKLPGVTLMAVEGETLQLVVRNDLPTNGPDHNPLRIEIPGLGFNGGQDGNAYTAGSSAPASTRGAAPSWTTYTWDNLPAGDYMYEAGPTDKSGDVSARQVAMGLKGLLIVRPKDFGANHGVFDLAGPAPATPTTACTAPGTSSRFTSEALVQVDDLNKEFHMGPWSTSLVPGGSTDPNAPGGGVDRTKYVPEVFVVNGQAFNGPTFDPATQQTVLPSDCLLLHEANLGEQEKTLGMIGRRQILIADDGQSSTSTIGGSPQYLEQDFATKYINPGEVANAVVDMSGSPAGTTYPIIDYGRHFSNGDGGTGPANLGGMITSVRVLGTAAPLATPFLSSAGLVLQGATPVPGDLPNITWTETNGTNGQGLELADTKVVHRDPPSQTVGGVASIDAVPPGGLAIGTCPSVPDPLHPCYTLGTTGDLLTGTIPPADLAKLGNGDHTLWIRAHDGNGWSDPATGTVFTVDNSPAVPPAGSAGASNLSVDPVATNGTTRAQVAGATGTALDSNQCGNCTINADQGLTVDGVIASSLPDWAITGFTWSILDGATTVNGPTAVTFLTPGADGAQVELTAADGSPFTIDTPTIHALPHPGKYAIQITPIEQQPSSANLTRNGTPETVDFTYATGGAGETTTIDAISPNPAGPQSDHTANLNYNPAVRVTGTLSIDATMLPGLNVANGEIAFVPVGAGGPPAPGSGTQVTPETGKWNSAKVAFQVNIPSSEFNALQQGLVRIYAHLKDSAGNWAPWIDSSSQASGDMILDKTPPTVSNTMVDHPVVHHPSQIPGGAGAYSLTFTAQDPPGPPPCTSGNLPVGCGGIAEQSKVAAVEWLIADATLAGPELNQNDFTVILPAPSNTPGTVTIDLSAGPQDAGGYPAGSRVEFRARDGAGNWTGWITADIPTAIVP